MRFLGISATNIVVGGGKVYFEDGATIYETSTDLTGLQVFHVNGEAPTGLAIDPAAGVFYETFGTDGVTALDLADPGFALRFLGISATNIVVGGGKVYFEDGASIYETSTDLTGLQVFHVNGEAPTGLAIDPAAGVFYETFGADGVTALDLADPGFALRFLGISATNIVVGGGKVYFEDGATIYETSTDLTGLQVFHVDGEAPTGLALYLAPVAAAIPETPTWAMLMLGVVGLGIVGHCRTKSISALNTVARSSSLSD